MPRTGFWPLAILLAGLLLVDGRSLSPRLPHSRLVAGGTTACARAEQPDPPVSAARAAWWWLWRSLAPPVVQAGAQPVRRIWIDTARRRLALLEDGRVVREYPVAVGKRETPTPPGEWRVVHKSTNWGGGFGTRWLGLNVPWGIYGIHGTNKPWSIGRYASSGCVRMFNRHVEDLYERVPLGTPVTVVGPLPRVAARPRLEPGTSGKAVLVLQVRLRQAGFDPGAVDGRYGRLTAERVRALQAFYGLPVTGVAGQEEQRLLGFPGPAGGSEG